MNAFLAQIQYRLKAILAAAFIALVGVAEWLVNDPATTAWVQSVLPEPFDKFAPPILGFIGVWLVHHFPNADKPATATDAAPVTELPENLSTTLLTVPTTADTAADGH